MKIEFELPNDAFGEEGGGLDAAKLNEVAREAFVMEAFRRGYFGKPSLPEPRKPLPFEELPDRLKAEFDRKLKNHMLDFGHWEINHEAVVKKAIEEWYVEEELEKARAKFEVLIGRRMASILGCDPGDMMILVSKELGRSAGPKTIPTS